MSIRLTTLTAVGVVLGLSGHANAQDESAHHGDMTIDPAAIERTARLGDRSFSPYANRTFPTRPLWGDQHIHTGWSFDAGFVNALSPEDALRFARGEQVESTWGVPVQLSRPLDWIAMTDHSDLLGVPPALRRGDPALVEADETLAEWSEIMQLNDIEAAIPVAMAAIQAQGNGTLPEAAMSEDFFRESWRDYTAIIERYNEPGRFTAMIGYEWTPNPGPGNNLHRNVIYRGGKADADLMLPYTTFESVDPEDLWEWMATFEDTSGTPVLAIPHNGNLSNGLMFAFETYTDQEPLDADYAIRRQRFEPIYELTQIKGDGEAHPALSPDDAFADYETWDEGNLNLTPKEEGDLEHEYYREALKNGMMLEQSIGENPFKIGAAGGTDAHTALSAVEEDNFFGKHSGVEPSPTRWEHVVLSFDGREVLGWRQASGAYTAVWATENTREAIWDAMKRRETYASTGPRMTVRFFGGWEFTEEDAGAREPGWIGYDKGVPMGADLDARPEEAEAPTFLVGAMKDPIGGNLDRIQIIKGWVDEDGETHEKVYNVAWSGDRRLRRNGSIEDVGNTVDVENATWTNTIGAAELITVWEDPDFDPDIPAVYYARVIQIPTPRWTAYEAKRFDLDLPREVPMTTQERAYTSPIWYKPAAAVSSSASNRPASAAAASIDIVGPQWRVVQIGRQRIPSRDDLILTIGEDGRIEGQGGCNSFIGNYTLRDNRVTVEPLAVTRNRCEPRVMALEVRLLDALEREHRLDRVGERIVLNDTDADERETIILERVD